MINSPSNVMSELNDSEASRRYRPGVVAALLVTALASGCGGGSGGGSGDDPAPAPSPTAGVDAGSDVATGEGSGGSTVSDDAPITTGSEAVLDPPTDTVAAPGDGSLVGTWDLCGGGSLRTTYAFSADRYDLSLTFFDGPDCTGEALLQGDGQVPISASGRYVLGELGTSEEGVAVRPIDLINTTSFGVEIPEAFRVVNYDIVHTGVAGQLIFGESSGESPEDRPTALDFDEPFLRR